MSYSKQKTVTFNNVTVIKDTPLAILCEFEDGEEHWIPQSQVDADSECYGKGDEGKLVITKWFADKEELEGGVRTDDGWRVV